MTKHLNFTAVKSLLERAFELGKKERFKRSFLYTGDDVVWWFIISCCKIINKSGRKNSAVDSTLWSWFGGSSMSSLLIFYKRFITFFQLLFHWQRQLLAAHVAIQSNKTIDRCLINSSLTGANEVRLKSASAKLSRRIIWAPLIMKLTVIEDQIVLLNFRQFLLRRLFCAKSLALRYLLMCWVSGDPG